MDTMECAIDSVGLAIDRNRDPMDQTEPSMDSMECAMDSVGLAIDRNRDAMD